MRLWIQSDLHVDVHGRRGHETISAAYALPDPQPEHDVVVLAGDVGEDPVKSIRWIAAAGFTKPVVFVCGNHEWYRHTIDRDLEKARAEAAKHPGIHLLQNDTVVIDGVRFVGAGLWTDYKLMREDQQWAAMQAADSSMNDHRFIRVARKGYSRFTPADALTEHMVSVVYIQTMLDTPFDGPTVVVTHHAPSIKSVHDRHWGDILNAAYASHLDHLVDRCTLWVHGHMHHAKQYQRGAGRVILNPRGYAALGKVSGWDPLLVVEV